MSPRLTAAHFDELSENGFVIIDRYIPDDQCAQMAAALRRILNPWDEVKDDPPKERTACHYFPYSEQILNQSIVDWEAICFSQKWLGTTHVLYRPGISIVRYPGFKSRVREAHIDNGNNSLLPVNGVREYGQISSWYFPEDVGPDNAPMRIVPREFGDDLSKCNYLTVPGNTQMIFNTHIWHSATVFQGDEGQRYSVNRIYGRADHYWEGVHSYTNQGRNERIGRFIGTLTARERELFRFPPVGNPYYTDKTLELLEAQYPGWNARNEYIPETHIAPGDQLHFGGTEKPHK